MQEMLDAIGELATMVFWAMVVGSIYWILGSIIWQEFTK
jgi:hypothetical protein